MSPALKSMTPSAVKSDSKKKSKNKRAAPEPDTVPAGEPEETGNAEIGNGVLLEDDPNEPTMGEKLASLELVENGRPETDEEQEEEEPSNMAPKHPSADSVNVLLKQALHADDRVLLLECLYNRDEKVISNSVSQLNPLDVMKFLHSLVAITQSRGAVLACALPWIKSLLLQKVSGIMSQESSLRALNSLYQLVESRVSTFESSLRLSSTLDFLYAGIIDDEVEENATVPVVFEDKDESDEEESEDAAMETDGDTEVETHEVENLSGSEEVDDMSDNGLP